MSFWSLIRFLHVTAAVLWVGGQLTQSLVLRPAALAALEESARRRLFLEAGRRFGRLSSLALIPTLVATGLALAWHRGVTLETLTGSSYGTRLTAKVVLAAIAFTMAGLHGALAARATSRAVRALGIAGAAASLVVVLLAASLVG